MADPVHTATMFLYVGSLIVNPPIIGGRSLVAAPDTNGNIAYTFTQPAEPCDGLKCEQEIFRIDKNPESCWIYQDISVENVKQAPGFFFHPVQTPEALTLGSLGNVNGRVFYLSCACFVALRTDELAHVPAKHALGLDPRVESGSPTRTCAKGESTAFFRPYGITRCSGMAG